MQLRIANLQEPSALGLLLPVELVHAVAESLDNEDLYCLTKVNQRLADIIFPLYLQRSKLQPSQRSLSLTRQAFTAFPAWLRSPSYSYKSSLFSHFSSDPAKAVLEAKNFRKALHILPPLTFRRIYLYMIPRVAELLDARQVVDLLDSVGQTQAISVNVAGFCDQASHPISCVGPFKGPHTKVNPYLEEFGLQLEGLLPCQPGYILSSFLFPSLKRLSVVSNTPLVSLRHFLARHPHLNSVTIESSDASDESAQPDVLSIYQPARFSMRSLSRLEGPLRRLSVLLESLSTPSLRYLHVQLKGIDKTAFADSFIEDLIQCLECCHSKVDLTVYMSTPHDVDMAICAKYSRALKVLNFPIYQTLGAVQSVSIEVDFPLNEYLILVSCSRRL